MVGSGAREHAITWRLAASKRVKRLFVLPGNAGTASTAINLPGTPEDLACLGRAVREHGIDLVVVGPEGPLAMGAADELARLEVPVFGPSEAAARIEASKSFARELMARHGIPTPDFRVFHQYHEARDFLSAHQGPVVVKADGLAAGKGVVVCDGKEEALKALHSAMVSRIFGPAGDTVVVEERLDGREVSVFAFSDGECLSPLVAACDYKRLLDGDMGPHTGGMGSYSPPEFWSPELAEQVYSNIMAPVVRSLRDEGAPYRGMLYAGLMLTEQGPKVIEFNCRLGDPEAQVILPLLEGDPVDAFLASAGGGLEKVDLRWGSGACVGVVLASGGYPGEYARGLEIEGLGDIDPDVLAFHGGTCLGSGEALGKVLTDGGRVMTLVARGDTVAEARRAVYENVARVHFPGVRYRKDIALPRGPAE